MFSLLVLFAPLCWGFGLGWPFRQERSPVSNIILVTVDDMGWGDASWNSVSPLSASNNPVDSTPFLRELTESDEGATVPRFYAQPTCSPTRASLMTGTYSWRSGLHELAVLGTGDNDCLGYLQSLGNASWDNKPVLLPRHLQNLGYRTHLVGKWHLGLGSRYCYPEQQGFDTFFGLHSGMHDHFQHTTASFCSPFDAGGSCLLSSENGELEGYDLHDRTRGRPRAADGPADANGDALDTGLNEIYNLSMIVDPRERYSSDVFTDRAVRLIEAHGDRTLAGRSDKFFMHLSLTAPHTPLQARTMDLEWCDTAAAGLVDPITWPNSSQRVLCGMHHSIDRSIESVVSALKAQGMWNDTVLFLSSDNGGLVGVGQSNGPFTGGKIEYWEGGIRVPALFAGGALAGLDLDFSELDVMHVIDILPTFLGLAGVSESDIAALTLDGRDIDVFGSSSLWGRSSLGPRWLVIDVLREVRYSLPALAIEWNFTTGTIMGPHRGTFWKYTLTPSRVLAPQTESTVHLYNLWADPTESTNLADVFPHVVSYFHSELESVSATAPVLKGGAYYFPAFPEFAKPPSPGGCWLAPDDPKYDTASCPLHLFPRTPTAPGSPMGYGTMCVAGEPISYPVPDSC